MTAPAIGANSRPLRFLIVTLVVAAYVALGFLLHPNLAAYMLLGVPITLAFQLGIHRQPLLTLWVRSGPPLRLDARFFLVWVLFSVVPAYNIVLAVQGREPWNALMGGAAVVGAFGLAYALQSMRAATVRQLLLCLLTGGGIAVLPILLTVVLPHFVHLRIGGQVVGTSMPDVRTILRVGVLRFLLGPVGFVVEEVFFRGALDTYVHRNEKGTGWASAIYVSALWGVWHLPGAIIPAGRLAPTVVGLVVSQIAVGVPLSYWWRKSGNLTVPDTTHAFLEVVRSAFAGGV